MVKPSKSIKGLVLKPGLFFRENSKILFRVSILIVLLGLGHSRPADAQGICRFIKSLFWAELTTNDSVKDAVPKQVFKSKRHKGRSRVIFTVGIPGSGKSSWVDYAESRGWKVIVNDKIRAELLIQMREKEELVKLPNGKEEVPDINNPAHLFSLGREVIDLSVVRMLDAMKSGESIIMDANNLDFARSERLMIAREQGYSVEAIVFRPKDIEANLNNVELRLNNGGHDIMPNIGGRPITKDQRRKKLRDRKNQMDANPLRVENNQFQNKTVEGSSEIVWEENSFVNSIYEVQVQDYSKSN